MRVRTPITAMLVALAASAAPLAAEPLAKEACDTLKAEQAELAAGGVKDDMAKGPEWAKANLSSDMLKRIETFIGLEEQLNFRCGLARIRFVLPPDDEAAPAPAPAVTPPAAKPKPKPKVVAKPVAKEAEPKAAAAPAEPAAKPKSKPKPKVDDAFRPPEPSKAEPKS